jgi:KDO2-lipid IV(A) lauroyltransferase
MLRYPAYWLAARLSQELPPPAAFRMAEWLADAWQRCRTGDRAAVVSNLTLALASRPPRPSLISEVFRNFGRYLVEFFTIHQISRPEVAVQGHAHLERAQAGGRGIIILTGHLGNWEVGGALLRRMGFPVSVVALPHAERRMDRLFNAQRQRCRLEVIPLDARAGQRGLRCLRQGHLLGLLGDREFSGQGMEVPMLGATLQLPRGPAILSLRSQCPIVPTFCVREGCWKFRLCFEPPLRPEGQSVRSLLQQYARVLERYIRRFPDQWLVFQPVAAG